MKLCETELILIEAEIRRFRLFFSAFGSFIFSSVTCRCLFEWEPVSTFIYAADLFIEPNIYWHEVQLIPETDAFDFTEHDRESDNKKKEHS